MAKHKKVGKKRRGKGKLVPAKMHGKSLKRKRSRRKR